MKKRLASFLLATAFVFVAGAAFAAWNVTTAVPSTGDFIFSATGVNDFSGVTKSADIKASGYTAADNPFNFAPSTDAKSIDQYVFGPSAVIASDDTGSGIGFEANATKKNKLFLRLPVGGAVSTTEIPVNFFGNVSLDEGAAGAPTSFDIVFSADVLAPVTSADFSFSGVAGVTSKDSKVGKLTVKVSKDFYGMLAISAGISTTPGTRGKTATVAAASFDLMVAVLKPNPAVRITYTYAGTAKTVIKDLVSGANTIEIPTQIGTAKEVSITAVENIGNIRLIPDFDGADLAGVDYSFPTASKFYPGAKDAAPAITLAPGDEKDLFGGDYKLKITWGGNLALTSAKTSGDVDAAITAAKKNVGLKEFKFEKTADFGTAAIVGVNLVPTFGTVDSTDFTFTASVDADLKDQRADADKPMLAALAFNARVTSPDALHIAMLALDMTLEISGDAMSDRLGAAKWKAMKKEDFSDKFFADFNLYKYFASGSKKVNLVELLGDKRSSYIVAALDGDNVTVQFKNVFLADGPSANGVAEAKFETLDGREVLVLFDGVRDGWIKDPTFVDGAVAPEPGKTVKVSNGDYKVYIGEAIAGNEASKDVVVTLAKTGAEALSDDVTDGTFSFSDVAEGVYTLSFSELKGYWTPDSVELKTADAVNDVLYALSEDVSYKEGGYLTVSVEKPSDFTGTVTFTLKNDSGAEVKTPVVEGKNALARGSYVLSAEASDVNFTVDLDKVSFTVDADENYNVPVVATVKSVAGGSSSGGGCNVGFAPMALLLLAPVMFLKK